MTKLDTVGYIIILFVSVLFAYYVQGDIEESIIEEILLDFGVKKQTSLQEQDIYPYPYQPFPLSPVGVLRLALRMKKFVIPWYICAAGTTIIITESINAKNILLNLIAIIFIAEADNIAYSMLFKGHQVRTEDFVKSSIEEDGECRLAKALVNGSHLIERSCDTFGSSRILAYFPVVAMTLSIPFANVFGTIFFPGWANTNTTPCWAVYQSIRRFLSFYC